MADPTGDRRTILCGLVAVLSRFGSTKFGVVHVVFEVSREGGGKHAANLAVVLPDRGNVGHPVETAFLDLLRRPPHGYRPGGFVVLSCESGAIPSRDCRSRPRGSRQAHQGLETIQCVAVLRANDRTPLMWSTSSASRRLPSRERTRMTRLDLSDHRSWNVRRSRRRSVSAWIRSPFVRQ